MFGRVENTFKVSSFLRPVPPLLLQLKGDRFLRKRGLRLAGEGGGEVEGSMSGKGGKRKSELTDC